MSMPSRRVYIALALGSGLASGVYLDRAGAVL